MLTHKVFTNSSTYLCTESTTEATTTETTSSTDTGKTISFMIEGHFSIPKSRTFQIISLFTIRQNQPQLKHQLVLIRVIMN